MTHQNPHDRGRRAWLRAPVALLAAAGIAAFAGCGGSSKPAYCSDRTNLENSIKGLTGSVTSGGISGLQTQIATIKSDATTLVNSAKSDFPTQTSAVKSSVDALDSAISSVSGSPSAANIAAIGTAAAGVVSSVNGFVDASKSKC